MLFFSIIFCFLGPDRFQYQDLQSQNQTLIQIQALDENGQPLETLHANDLQVTLNRGSVPVDAVLSDQLSQNLLIFVLDLLPLTSNQSSVVLADLHTVLERMPSNRPILIQSLAFGFITPEIRVQPHEAIADLDRFAQVLNEHRQANNVLNLHTRLNAFQKDLQRCLQYGHAAQIPQGSCTEKLILDAAAVDYQRSETVLTALQELLQGLAEIPENKQLVLLSPGLNLQPGIRENAYLEQLLGQSLENQLHTLSLEHRLRALCHWSTQSRTSVSVWCGSAWRAQALSTSASGLAIQWQELYNAANEDTALLAELCGGLSIQSADHLSSYLNKPISWQLSFRLPTTFNDQWLELQVSDKKGRYRFIHPRGLFSSTSSSTVSPLREKTLR